MGLKALITFLTAFTFYAWLPIIVASEPVHAEAPMVQAGWESYSDRPSIYNVPAAARGNDAEWTVLRQGHLSFVAFMLEAYSPETQIHFLARDAEYLYDLAKLITKGTVEEKRIHLLNVSRANMGDRNLKRYLEVNGITENILKSGQKTILVDTGFVGTIPAKIATLFSEKAQANMKTQLISSSNPSIPSARNFLVHLNPQINFMDPGTAHGTIIGYEYMPRYTDRSTKYQLTADGAFALSQVGSSSDGTVSKELALEYMADLKFYWNQKETQQEFERLRAEIRNLKDLLTSADRESAKRKLITLAKTPLTASFILDLIDSAKNTGLPVSFSARELGFIPMSQGVVSSKWQTLQKYPEWAQYLTDPEQGVETLFENEDWQTIGAFIDANIDAEINMLIANRLFQNAATGKRHDLQEIFIKKSSVEIQKYLITKVFLGPRLDEMPELVELLLETSPLLKDMITHIFSQPSTFKIPGILDRLLEKCEREFVAAVEASRGPYNYAQPTAYVALLTLVLNQPHDVGVKNVLKKLINTYVFEGVVAQGYFTVPLLKALAANHSEDMQSNVWLLIRRMRTINVRADYNATNDRPTDGFMAALAEHLLSKRHMGTNMRLLRYVVANAGSSGSEALLKFVFSQPWASTAEHEMLKRSLSIKIKPLRRAFVMAGEVHVLCNGLLQSGKTGDHE